MTSPEPKDSTTTTEGAAPASAADAAAGVRGGSPDRMDAAPGSGGLAGAGADGETGAREQLRKDLDERPSDAGTEEGGDLEQAAAIGETDDPQGGSLQPGGAGA
ncbi:MAG TPA: hypothetical protein VM433_14930 [Mycobacteriales bacterium]|nr:hypothetical protein [Mycobacteriales bacterium]